MSLRNYITETQLQGYLYEKTRLLWQGQTDFSIAQTQADGEVLRDFITTGYTLMQLRPDLFLRTDTATISASTTGTSYEDKCQRLRLAYLVTVRTGTTSLVLQGSNDETTWYTVSTQSIVDADISIIGSFTFTAVYKYYRINSTITAGTLAFTAWMAETIFDSLYLYRWLYVILINAGKAQENKYTEYANIFLNMYNDAWAKLIVWLDTNLDGVADEKSKPSLVRAGR